MVILSNIKIFLEQFFLIDVLFFNIFIGIVMTMEKKSIKKIERLVKCVEKLKRENEQLNLELAEKKEFFEKINHL